jgi:hypothetical protein
MSKPTKDNIDRFLTMLEDKGYLDHWSATGYLQEEFDLTYREAKDWTVWWSYRHERESELEEMLTNE